MCYSISFIRLNNIHILLLKGFRLQLKVTMLIPIRLIKAKGATIGINR